MMPPAGTLTAHWFRTFITHTIPGLLLQRIYLLYLGLTECPLPRCIPYSKQAIWSLFKQGTIRTPEVSTPLLLSQRSVCLL